MMVYRSFTYTNIYHNVKNVTQIDDFTDISNFKTNKSATWLKKAQHLVIYGTTKHLK